MGKKYSLIIIILIFCLSTTNSMVAQVGINTTSPAAGSMLDVTSTNKGVLLPRVNIADLNTIAPVTGGATTGLMVYNTNTTTGPGYFYWNGSIWVGLSNTDDWKTSGNAGTTPGTGTNQNYLGTADAQDLVVATNGTERFRISSDGRILATQGGSEGTPLFAWTGDTDKGFYSSGADQFSIVTNGIQRFNLSNNDIVANEPGNDVDFRIESNGQANMFVVNGGTNAIGIGTNTPNGALEVNSSNSGLVLPKVALTSTTSASPVVNPNGGNLALGTTVYNTATAGTSPNDVAPGMYYWDGTRWIAYAGSPGGLDWTLTGNSGTALGTNFLGTTDNVPLDFRTNSTSHAWMNTNGFLIVNSDGYFGGYSFFSDTQLQSMATGAETAIGGYGNSTEETYYGQNIGGGTVGTFLNTAGDGFRSMTSFATGNGVQGTGGALSYYAYPGVPSGGVFAGVYGASGVSLSTTGTGLAGLGQGRTIIVVDPNGSGVAGSGDGLGVFGYAGNGTVNVTNEGNAGGEFVLDSDNDATTNTGNDATRARAKLAGYDDVSPNGTATSRTSYYGGYFSGGSEGSNIPSYAYVGMRYRTNTNGDGVSGGSGQDYKIIGTGTVSTLIDGPDGNPRVMFAPEAPEILFQDFGVGQLVNGVARIEIDPILKKSIYVDADNPLKVYVTLEGECNGVFVTDKSADGFTVKELQGGSSNAAFSWQIVANRADRIGDDGVTIVSKHIGVRLPEGPGALKSKDYIVQKIEKTDEKLKENAISVTTTNNRPTINAISKPINNSYTPNNQNNNRKNNSFEKEKKN